SQQNLQHFLSASEGEGGNQHLAAAINHGAEGFDHAAFFGGTHGVELAAVGAFEYQRIGFDARRLGVDNGAVGSERDIAGHDERAIFTFEHQRGSTHNVAGGVIRDL